MGGRQGETICELRLDNTGQCEDGAPFRWQSNGKQILVTDETGMRRIPYTLMKDKLVLSLDGVPVALSRIDVKQNSNGHPIIKADTTEYMLCG